MAEATGGPELSFDLCGLSVAQGAASHQGRTPPGSAPISERSQVKARGVNGGFPQVKVRFREGDLTASSLAVSERVWGC